MTKRGDRRCSDSPGNRDRHIVRLGFDLPSFTTLTHERELRHPTGSSVYVDVSTLTTKIRVSGTSTSYPRGRDSPVRPVRDTGGGGGGCTGIWTGKSSLLPKPNLS